MGSTEEPAIQQCPACLLPNLFDNCDPNLLALFNRDHRSRDVSDPTCRKEAFFLAAPPLTSLRRTAVMAAMGLHNLQASYEMAKWLATPWPALPTLSMLHRLTILHYFLLPGTRHSPLSGGFHLDPTTGTITPDLGPSKENLAYMRGLEASVVYASIQSVRPQVTSRRTVEMIGLDGKPSISTKTEQA
jgi:hypothetical protein